MLDLQINITYISDQDAYMLIATVTSEGESLSSMSRLDKDPKFLWWCALNYWNKATVNRLHEIADWPYPDDFDDSKQLRLF